MCIQVISHVPYEDLGVIDNWIAVKNYALSRTRSYAGECLRPTLETFDFLILMSGLQIACVYHLYDYLLYDYLQRDELIQAGKPSREVYFRNLFR
ncbi:hypothetical protein [Coxiella-like endosymbiont]|uniref:hypothetical protein n=1 Tax=Coxiella-like endosymbiont TaxID=1592897 RepID=UPI00272AB4E7|nr:hypothetical protein [Coxiella-like endosymbiont]